jgi:acetyl esterase/lipase
VYFHGGGWIAGDLDSEHVRCVRFAAQSGCVVVSVAYRLAPEHRFPAPVDDCYAALSWTAGNADDLDLDARRIGVGGVSAGGNLAAAVTLMARDRGGPSTAFQLLAFPVLDDRMRTPSMTFVGTPLVDGQAIARTWSFYLGDDRSDVSPYAAPARAEDLRGLPPTFLATAEFDPLRDEGIEYGLRLLAADVTVELHNFAGTFHAFDTFATEVSTRAANEQTGWLRRVSH